MDRRADAAVAGLFVVVGIFIAYGALTLPTSSLNRDAVGPAGLPLVLAAVLVVGGAIQILRTAPWVAGEGWIVATEGADDDGDHPVSSIRPIAFILGGLLYALLLNPIGYLALTPVVVAVGLWALNVRNSVLIAAAAIGYTVLSFIVFSEYLGVPVPTGILTDLLVDLGWIDAVR